MQNLGNNTLYEEINYSVTNILYRRIGERQLPKITIDDKDTMTDIFKNNKIDEESNELLKALLNQNRFKEYSQGFLDNNFRKEAFKKALLGKNVRKNLARAQFSFTATESQRTSHPPSTLTPTPSDGETEEGDDLGVSKDDDSVLSSDDDDETFDDAPTIDDMTDRTSDGVISKFNLDDTTYANSLLLHGFFAKPKKELFETAFSKYNIIINDINENLFEESEKERLVAYGYSLLEKDETKKRKLLAFAQIIKEN